MVISRREKKTKKNEDAFYELGISASNSYRSLRTATEKSED